MRIIQFNEKGDRYITAKSLSQRDLPRMPLLPLLFVWSTQPLMGYIQHKMEEEELGVKIKEGLTFCHRLFADNIGIFIPDTKANFTKLQEILELYKVALGAKPNLSKSVIIPLALPIIPQWIHGTGCIVNQPGEIQKHMGAPFG